MNLTLHLPSDPAMKARITYNQSMVHLEPPEVLAVLRAAKKKSARSWAMLLVAYKHGLRASEVCDLRLADIDLKNGGQVLFHL